MRGRDRFKQGQRVIITHGPYAGQRGTISTPVDNGAIIERDVSDDRRFTPVRADHFMFEMSMDAKRLAQLIAELTWRQQRYEDNRETYLDLKLERNAKINLEAEPDAIFFFNQFDMQNQIIFMDRLQSMTRMTLGQRELELWCIDQWKQSGFV